MQLEVGAILEGKVTGITKFGAFVELDLPEKKVGLVHISEVSNGFVKEIKDHLTDGQKVKVKVLNVTDGGKIGLSIKQTIENNNISNNNNKFRKIEKFSGEGVHGGRKPLQASAPDFENLLNKFKKTSEERISDYKRSTEGKFSKSSKRSSQK